MSGQKFPGVIKGSIIEVRFPFSGQVASVAKKVGDHVKPRELIASLDSALQQKELDVQLADFERERAAFEIFALKNKDADDITKYEKVAAQAKLNSSVKAVELAKARLDAVHLFSPVTGLVTDTGGVVPGLHVTPSANSFQVLDYAGFSFQFSVIQEQLSAFRQPHRAVIRLPQLPPQFSGITSAPLPGSKSGFVVNIPLEASDLLLPGLSGECELLE